MAIPCQDIYKISFSFTREEIKIQYIYQIENIVNGIKYYGRTNNPKIREGAHFSELRRGVHINSKLQNSFNKYGEDKFIFSILEEVEEEEGIFEIEEKYLNLNEEKFNLSLCSRSPGRYRFFGEDNGFYGKTHSEETKRRIGEQASIRYTGKGNPFYGKAHSKETREKISKANTGRFKGVPKSEKFKTFMRENNPNNIAVVINGKEYRSMSEAARYLGVDRKTISYRIKSKSKQFEGYLYK